MEKGKTSAERFLEDNGIDLSKYPVGYTLQFRRPARICRDFLHASFFDLRHLIFTPEDLILFTVGVHTVEWLEEEMQRRIYRPMIRTQFDPDRLPS